MRPRTWLASIPGLVVVLLLASCAAPQDERGGPDPGLRGQWELRKATDDAGAIPLANQLISLTINGDSSTSGRSTCSDYHAHVYGTIAQLWITTTLPGTEHCETRAQKDIEQRYLRDLSQVRSSTIADGVLDLLGPRGLDLQYQRALDVPLNFVVGHTWTLTAVSEFSYAATSSPTPTPENGASIRFGVDGALTGRTGCGSFTARYEENAGEIVTTGLRDTPSGLCDDESRAVDVAVLKVLRSGFTFLSEIGGLQLTSPRAGLRLRFVD